MIILEGPDCGGKSTLAELWPLPESNKIHFSHQEDKLTAYKKFLSEHRGRDMLLDRFHISEQVYGPILRNSNELLYTGRFLERELLADASCVVLCLPPWPIVRYQWQKRIDSEMVKDVEVMRAIYEAYHEIETDLKVFLFDYTKDPLPRLVDKVNRFMHCDNKMPHGFFGSPFATVLLVGDEVSSQEQHGVPFTRDRVGCSTWLAKQLHDAGISEGHLAWVNSTPDLTKKQVDFIQDRFPNKIALGVTAEYKLRQLGFSMFETVQHPQYWKRFLSKEPYPLIAKLKRMIG